MFLEQILKISMKFSAKSFIPAMYVNATDLAMYYKILLHRNSLSRHKLGFQPKFFIPAMPLYCSVPDQVTFDIILT